MKLFKVYKKDFSLFKNKYGKDENYYDLFYDFYRHDYIYIYYSINIPDFLKNSKTPDEYKNKEIYWSYSNNEPDDNAIMTYGGKIINFRQELRKNKILKIIST